MVLLDKTDLIAKTVIKFAIVVTLVLSYKMCMTIVQFSGNLFVASANLSIAL